MVKSPEYLATIVPSVTDAKAVYSSRDSRCSKMYSLLDLYRFLSPDRKRTMSVRHFQVDLRKCVKVNFFHVLSTIFMYYSTSEKKTIDNRNLKLNYHISSKIVVPDIQKHWCGVKV